MTTIKPEPQQVEAALEAADRIDRIWYKCDGAREHVSVLAAEVRRLRAEASAIEARVLDAEKTRDAQWYDAMKWAGIGGLMRVKVMNKMRETAERVKAAAARGGK